MVKRRKNKLRRDSLIQLALIFLIIVVVNVLSNFLFKRFDFTGDKRFSLSPASRELAKNLDDIIYFKIYLGGDLPPGFTRLRNSFRELLDEFRVYAGDNIEYEFVDPSAIEGDKERNDLYRQLTEKGLFPTSLEQKDKTGESQQLIFPGAIATFRSQEFVLQILKSKMGSSPDEMLNNSVANLEYEISSVLRKAMLKKRQTVAFLRGHEETTFSRIADAASGLSEFFQIDTVTINGRLNALDEVTTLIVCNPKTFFSERDKFIIDQFIMKGGHVFWLIDKMEISMDSLVETSSTIALARESNLDDMLFRYGARINPDLILDLQAAPIPIVTGYVGNQPKQQLFPWYFSPLLDAASDHPVVKNLNPVKAEFVSSIDTIESDDVKKTILLASGRYSRLVNSPARVSLNMLRETPDPRLFTRHHISSVLLLEGRFSSNYKNRVPAQIATSPEIAFAEKSKLTSMIISSDADMIENFVSKKGAALPLGYDRFTGQTYGNKPFFLNCIDYLCGNSQILTLRTKEIRLRLLDAGKSEQVGLLKWINLLFPPLLVIVCGIFYNLFRRKKYAAR